jgi:hypothetical protein
MDQGNGTILDTQTNLIWEKKSDDGSLHDKDTWLPWSGRCTVITSKYCQPDAAAKAQCELVAGTGRFGCDMCGSGEGTCNINPLGYTPPANDYDLGLVGAAQQSVC